MNDINEPPSEWFSERCVRLNDLTYVLPPPPGGSAAEVLVFHWCYGMGRWSGAYCAKHELKSADPLHLEPSLACEYNKKEPHCSWHGFIRNGAWEPA